MRPGGLLRANSLPTGGLAEVRLSNVRSALLSVVFPAGCRVCEQLLTEATRIAICNDCLGSFGPIAGTVCDKCGEPVEGTAHLTWKHSSAPRVQTARGAVIPSTE